MQVAMLARIWGTRGSIAAPGPHTARYGGNTSCVEVRASDGTVIILDCGTGARELGMHLAETVPQPMRLHLFIGHTHWDHIQGFPFFVPAFIPGVELNVYAPLGFQQSLEEAMAGQMEYSYFPVKLRELRSRIHYTELDEGLFRVGEVRVETQYLNHTGPTIGYRLSSGGATLAYMTDHEPFWSVPGRVSQHPGDERHIAFMRGADLVIHDAQYTEEEYRSKVGWGHSPLEYAVDVALAAGARRLALFHHDPQHDDTIMERIESEARARAVSRGAALEVLAAREGLELELSGNGSARDVGAASALQHRQIAGGRVLVVSGDDKEIAAIEEVLGEDALVLLRLADMSAVLSRGSELRPDLAIIDRGLLTGEGALATLRARLGRGNLPVVVLADGSEAADVVAPAEAASTDYLARPFSPPMLRARVRAWLSRTRVASDATRGLRARPAEDADRVDLRSRRASLLASVPLFGSLTNEEIFAAGHSIIQESDPPDRLFVILAGRARALETAPGSPTEVILSEFGEGEILGELAVIRNRARSATVVAIERTHCLVLNRNDFLRVLETSVRLALALLRTVAGRLAETDRRLSRYAPDPVTGLASRRAF